SPSPPLENVQPVGTPYHQDQVRVLRTGEHIRRRPCMFIGSVDVQGIHYLVFELINKAVDQFMAGKCSRISVDLLPDGGCRVGDNGPGIDVEIDERTDERVIETIFNAYPIPNRLLDDQPRTACGLRGIGLRAVSALSEQAAVENLRDGQVWFQRYQR